MKETTSHSALDTDDFPRAMIPAVVVGMEGNGLGVARSLRGAGIPVIGIALPEWNPACLTRCASIRRLTTWNAEALKNELLRLGAEYVSSIRERLPLILTKDEAVLWISEHRDEILRYFSIPLPSPTVVHELMDKSRFHSAALSRGLPVPRTWLIASREQLLSFGSEFVFPTILKPQVKNAAYRSSWLQKAFRADNLEQLLSAYDRVAPFEPEVVVQQWISGQDDHVVFVLGYWSSASEPLALFSGRKIRQYPLGHGNTASAEPAPAAWKEKMEQLALRVSGEFGFQGLNSVEFKVDADTGELFITEPTVSRTNYQSESAVVNGVNLPLVAYQDARGRFDRKAIADFTVPGRPTKWIDARADRKAARMLIAGGHLRTWQWFKTYLGRKRFTYFRLNDPLPWFGRLLPARIAQRL